MLLGDDELTPTLLAAGAGATNLVSVACLGGALSGIVTGDLVTLGSSTGQGHWSLLHFPVVAVLFYGFGVVLWSRIGGSVIAGLLTELGLLAVVAAGLAITGTTPGRTVATALLACAATALGVQSVVSFAWRSSTTYMTGLYTTALHSRVTEGRSPWRDLGRLLAVLTGAVAAGAVLHTAGATAALLPVVLVVAALVSHTAYTKEQARGARSADAPSS